MPQSYGTILSSTPESITRMVVIDGSVTIQTLTIAQEVTLTPCEVAHLVQVVDQAPARRAPHLSRFGSLPIPGMTCSCDEQAGVHVFTEACRAVLREGA